MQFKRILLATASILGMGAATYSAFGHGAPSSTGDEVAAATSVSGNAQIAQLQDPQRPRDRREIGQTAPGGGGGAAPGGGGGAAPGGIGGGGAFAPGGSSGFGGSTSAGSGASTSSGSGTSTGGSASTSAGGSGTGASGTSAGGAASTSAGGSSASGAAASGSSASTSAGGSASTSAGGSASTSAGGAASTSAGGAASSSGGGSSRSDLRLKRDIAIVGRRSDGLALYRYRYLWSDVEYVGVMAQDVQQVLPEAVSHDEEGYLMVDYTRLATRLMTWDEWRQSQPEAGHLH